MLYLVTFVTSIPALLLYQPVLDAGLELERFAEGGRPVPVVLAIRARKPG